MSIEMPVIYLWLMLFSGSPTGHDLVSQIEPDFYWQTQGIKEVTVEAMLPLLVDENTPELEKKINRLIKQLGDRSFENREQAYKQLADLGTRATQALEKASQSEDIEISAAVRKLLKANQATMGYLQVRRLMAIRTLGTLKNQEAISYLKPLLESKDSFVVEYATRALAQLTGEKYQSPVIDDVLFHQDVLGLPKDITAVSQFRFVPDKQVTDTSSIIAFHPEVMAGEVQSKVYESDLNQKLIDVAHRIGNVRIDGVTLAFEGKGEKEGILVFHVRGQWNREYIEKGWIKTDDGLDSSFKIGQAAVFHDKSADAAVIAMYSNSHGALIWDTAYELDEKGIREVLRPRSKEESLASNQILLPRIKKLQSGKSVLWALVQKNKGIFPLEEVETFDWAELTVGPDQEAGNKDPQWFLQASGRASDENKLVDSMSKLQDKINLSLIKGIENVEKDFDPKTVRVMQPFTQVLQQFKIKTEGDIAQVNIKLSREMMMKLVPSMIRFLGY